MQDVIKCDHDDCEAPAKVHLSSAAGEYTTYNRFACKEHENAVRQEMESLIADMNEVDSDAPPFGPVESHPI